MAVKFRRLTRPAVRVLQSGQSLQEHGIIATRQPNGDVCFSINIMVDGNRIHRTIGTASDGVTREQAERAVESFRTKAREDRLELPTGRKIRRTFHVAGEEYLAIIGEHPKHRRNIARKRHHIRKRLAPYFGRLRLDRLTDFGVAQYVRQRETEGAAQATINRELSTLSHFLSRCAEWGWIKSKPRIDKGQEVRKQIVVLNEAEKRALVRGAMSDQDPLTALFVVIGTGTGMRHSEILRIRWEEIDFAQRRIYIGKAKAGQREQPIPTWLADFLKLEWEQLGEPAGYLFPTARADAKSPHRQTMAAQFRRAVERAKLDPTKVRPHILRHTAITGLVKARVDLPTIQKISGHKTLAMVLRYTQLSDSHVDASLALLDGGFVDAITQELHSRPKTTKRGAV